MDAAIRAALRCEDERPPGCDAELAAAYLERRLGPQERQRFETHMAECAGCRALTAALAPELMPETAEPAPASHVWGWRWAVPAVAGLVIVGSVVYYQRTPPVAPAKQQAVAVGTIAERPAVVDQPATTKPPQKPPAERKRSPAAGVSAVKVETPAPPPPAQAPAPAAVEEAQQLRGAGQAATQPVAPQKEKFAERREAVRLLSTSADSAAPAGGVAAALRLSSQLSPLPEGALPKAMVEHDGTLWAVSDGGRIFRSGDRGRTWMKVESPTSNDLLKVKWDAQKNLLVVEDKQGNRFELRP